MTKKITIIVSVLAVIVMVVWDLIVNFNKIEGDTISEVTGAALRSAPILGVVLGVVLGHLGSNFPMVRGPVMWIGERPIISIVTGLVVGFFFWNMDRP